MSDLSNRIKEKFSLLEWDREKISNLTTHILLNGGASEKTKNQFDQIRAQTQDYDSFDDLPDNHAIFLHEFFKRYLGVHLLEDKFLGRLSTNGDKTKNCLSYIFFISCTYFLFGGLIEGKSSIENFATQPYLAILSLVFGIILLALLEGSQISITSLRLKDISGLQGDSKKAYNIQKNYRFEEDIQKYLAGRQLFTISVVFMISQITSMPNMNNYPFTGIPFHEHIYYWFKPFFLDLGMLGALFTLWFGQLAPQFYANKNPISFLQIPGVGIIVSISSFLDKLAITTFGSILTSRVKGSMEAPTPDREKYESFLSSRGYAINGLKLKWKISKNKIVITRTEEIEFHNISSDTMSLKIKYPQAYKDFKRSITCSIYSGAGERNIQMLNADFYDDHRDYIQYEISMAPQFGSFQPGDLLRVTLELIGDSIIEEIDHRVSPSMPTRYMSLVVEVEDDVGLSTPRLHIIKRDEITSLGSTVSENTFKQSEDENKPGLFSYLRLFPDIDDKLDVKLTVREFIHETKSSLI